MWIVSGSGSHAAAAAVSETRMRELVRELARVIPQAYHSTTPNQVLFAFASHIVLSDQPWQQWRLSRDLHPRRPRSVES